MKDKKPERLTVLSMNTPSAGAREDVLHQNGDPGSGHSVAVVKEDVTLSYLGPDGKTKTRKLIDAVWKLETLRDVRQLRPLLQT